MYRDEHMQQRIHLILLQIPSDHKHSLPIRCGGQFLDAPDTLETLESGAILRQHNVDLQAITNLV